MTSRYSVGLAALVLCCLSPLADARAESADAAKLETATSVGRGQPTRINVNFRIALDESAGSDEAASEQARKSIYAQAARECLTLVASFPGVSCTLENLNVMAQGMNSGERRSPFLMGNAVYQLRAK